MGDYHFMDGQFIGGYSNFNSINKSILQIKKNYSFTFIKIASIFFFKYFIK